MNLTDCDNDANGAAAATPASCPESFHVREDSNRRDAGIELCAVLSIAWLPPFYSAVTTWLYPQWNVETTFAFNAVTTIVSSLSTAAILLFVMYRSSLPWRDYGIVRPSFVVDTSLGAIVWIAVVVIDLFVIANTGRVFGMDAVLDFTRATYDFPEAKSKLDFLLLVPMYVVAGFSEEITMRGYLIPRFRQLFGSTWRAVVVSTAFFASYHIYQGIGVTLSVAVTGLVLGTGFVLTRRLWPVVIGHALSNILPIL